MRCRPPRVVLVARIALALGLAISPGCARRLSQSMRASDILPPARHDSSSTPHGTAEAAQRANNRVLKSLHEDAKTQATPSASKDIPTSMMGTGSSLDTGTT